MNKKGFTLIELLIVVAIIGIIAAIVIPNIVLALQKGKQKSTMEDMRNVGHACQMFDENFGNVPQVGSMEALADDDQFTRNYMRIVPVKDHWGQAMRYEMNIGERVNAAGVIAEIDPAVDPNNEYRIVSLGKDNVDGPAPVLPWKIVEMDDFNPDLRYSSGGFSQAPTRLAKL